MARIEAGQLTLELRAFDLRAELAGVVELARLRAAEKGLAFEARLGPGARGGLRGDPVRIRQILGHLASNAVKFTDEGSVRLAIDVHDEDGGEDGAAVLALEVEDTGIGFDDATGDTLFRRFEQAEGGLSRERGGTGLGLGLCKALSDLMGGSITARSHPGRGSRFTVRLPLARVEPAAAPARRASGRPPGPAGGALPVLLVEDQAANRKVVELLLARSGMTLAMAENGALGVEAWRAAPFDVGAHGPADARHGRPDRHPRDPRAGAGRAGGPAHPHRRAERQRDGTPSSRGPRGRRRPAHPEARDGPRAARGHPHRRRGPVSSQGVRLGR